jgi:hypothetical protein
MATAQRPAHTSQSSKVAEYNESMKRAMANPYEYHHDLGEQKIQLICSESWTGTWLLVHSVLQLRHVPGISSSFGCKMHLQKVLSSILLEYTRDFLCAKIC